MKTYIQRGENLTVTAPYDVTAGHGALIGSLFGFALNDATSGDTDLVIVTEGVFNSTQKLTGEAWSQGDALYWNDSSKLLTKTNNTAGSLPHVGTAIADAQSADTEGKIKLVLI